MKEEGLEAPANTSPGPTEPFAIKHGDHVVLAPSTDPAGHNLNRDQAFAQYLRTGKHLGIYDSMAHAVAAKVRHRRIKRKAERARAPSGGGQIEAHVTARMVSEEEAATLIPGGGGAAGTAAPGYGGVSGGALARGAPGGGGGGSGEKLGPATGGVLGGATAAQREAAYREIAKARGIDPDKFVTTAKREGLNYRGPWGGGMDHGTSFGDFQMHRGGPGSVGYEYEKKYGVMRPEDWYRMAEFSANWIARFGYDAWSSMRGTPWSRGTPVEPTGGGRGDAPTTFGTTYTGGRTLYPTVGGELSSTERYMDPELRARLLRMAEDSPYGGARLMGPRSGYRTHEEQEQLLRAKHRPGYVGGADTSRHRFGLAADLRYASKEELAWYHAHAAEYGITFPLMGQETRKGHYAPFEPWHAQLSPGYRGPAAYIPPSEDTRTHAIIPSEEQARADKAIPTGKQQDTSEDRSAPLQVGKAERDDEEKEGMGGYYNADQHGHRNVIRRVIVYQVDDTQPQQTIWAQGLHDEEIKWAYRAQDFGLSSVPPLQSEGYALSLAGRPDQIFFTPFEHKDYRPTNKKPGESFLYDAFGNIIKMHKPSNNDVVEIYVDSSQGKVTVKGAKDVTLESRGETVTVKGAKTVNVESTSQQVTINGAQGVTVSNALQVNGPVHATGNVSSDGNVAATGTVTGSNIP